jgi:hypothetical protein
MVFNITTDGSGDDTILGEGVVTGWLYKVEWVDGDLADGVDAVLSVTGTPDSVDETIATGTNLNDDATYYTLATYSAIVWNAGGGFAYPLLNGQPKLVVSSGGDEKSGAMRIWWFR